MASILLLEPYRSALMADALSAGLASIVGEASPEENPAILIGRSPVLQQIVREFGLLFDGLQVIHYERPGQAEELAKDGIPTLSALRLQEQGIASFPPAEPDEARRARLAKLSDLRSWWLEERELIETWKPLIVSQIQARGKLADESLFDVLQYERLGNAIAYEQALDAVPPRLRSEVDRILSGYAPLSFDAIVFSTLNELLAVDSVVQRSRPCVALDQRFGRANKTPTAEATSHLRRVMLEALLDAELRFPVAESLFEMDRIRRTQEMASFRETFQPWLRRLSEGGQDEELRLRREVRRAIRQFRNQPRLQTARDLSAVLAVPAALIHPIAGAALNLTTRGLERLSVRWATESAWVGLCAEA